ncbi:MAG: peptidoglycan DD-metalloendopeptidase family protein [Anaerolineae bacterium]|nr:peptidoglycan DD-metalloendopeptidase family protein [Anaerolineae bacterium]
MSLNLRFGPRRHVGRIRLFLLILIAVLLSSLAAWQRGWRPEQVLAEVREAALPHMPVPLPEIPIINPQPQSDTVVMVDSNVIENPQSTAYTANLYNATGKDPIPWPNIAGRTAIEIYTVESGDSLWSIANQFELDLDTLRWSNPELERNPDILSVGTELRILPVQGVYHLTQPGDTIEAIAEQYGVAPKDIVDYPPNALFPPYELDKIEGVIVPFGRKDINLPPPAPSLDFPIAWPVAGIIQGSFSDSHPAIDIGAPFGSPVYAADDGIITFADQAQDGLGYGVIIDHNDGRQTWYSHLRAATVETGATVSRGTPIGEVGSTGHDVGPHVHFELHLDGQPVDPLIYLPGVPQ